MIMTFKSKIASYFKSKKVNVFLLFLIIALVFSILTKLSDDYTHTIAFSIEAENIPEEQIIVRDSSHAINITLTTYGFRLMKYYLSKPSLKVDFTTLDKNTTHYFWIQNKELPDIISQLDPGIKIESVNPDTIRFRYDVNHVKNVAVILNAEVNFSPGFDLVDTYKITPDSIKVIGPKILIDSIERVETQLLKLNAINSGISVPIQLKFPSDLPEVSFSRDEVEISGAVEKFTEGSITVPVNIINIPDDLKLNFYPKTVSVLYYTSLTNFERISSSSFIVECDYKELNAGDTYLIPKVTEQPDGVRKVRLNEKRIEFILLQ
jgi:hypothetical protein